MGAIPGDRDRDPRDRHGRDRDRDPRDRHGRDQCAIQNWEFALADPKSESGHRRVAVAALGISGLPTNYPGSFAPSNRRTLWNIGVIRDELAVFHYSTDQKVKIRVFDLCSF